MSQRRRLSWAEVRAAVLDCGVLSLACLAAYWLVTFVFPACTPCPEPTTLLAACGP